MARNARTTSLKDALTQELVCVPIRFFDGEARIDVAVPGTIGPHELPKVLSAEWCDASGLKSDVGSVAVLRSTSGTSVALISLGPDPTDTNAYRLVGASAQRLAGTQSFAVLISTDGLEDAGAVAQSVVEGVILASYAYKAKNVDATVHVVPLGQPLPTVAVHDAFEAGVERGALIANAVNWAKRLVDSPAGTMSPKELARSYEDRLEGIADVAVEVWTESKIKEEGLGGLLGVGAGSAEPTRLVYATYSPQSSATLPHVALVGKGVTFDSGGLSMKSPEGMMAMKTDMTGAAVVMSVLSLVSALKLPVRMTVITPLTENLVGDRATKPGDVLTIRNGMTIEVLNTDAEGRLILADGLSLAAESDADVIIDVATLTGAQNVALGDEVGAIFSSSDELVDGLMRASADSGEPFWRMPLVDSYEAHFESDIADMKNMGRPPRAGAIIGALILRRFTNGKPWAHLDIAGPSRADSARGYTTKGGTAYAARTLFAYIAGVAKDGVAKG